MTSHSMIRYQGNTIHIYKWNIFVTIFILGLRRLEISTSSSIDITDASIIYGIIYCESLKVLILRNIAVS